MSSNTQVLRRAVLTQNPAWAQLLGLCPLMAVSTTVVNALGLAAASSFVVIGSNVMISSLRHHIPEQARLPCFVLIIATFTTVTTLVLEAFSYELYLKIALFVQIIVTNCMILGRAEAFASRQPVIPACFDAVGTAVGFAIALITLGSVRELLAYGSLFRDADLLFGQRAGQWTLQLVETGPVPLAAYAPGAFIVAGLMFAMIQGVSRRHPDVKKPGIEGT